MKKSYSKCIVCVCTISLSFVLLAIPSKAQQSNAQLIPQVLPPSPEVASLGKFGSYPVNHFTGLANIDIPLYEIVVGNIAIPISLSYHPSGIKVTDRASSVGLGWSLSAGGSISRRLMSLPDDLPGGYLKSATVPTPGSINTNTMAGLQILHDINRGIKDTEPDVFSYSFPGKSGQFVFSQLNNNKPFLIPYNPIKIGHTIDANGLRFEITDVDGVQYKFNETMETGNTMYGYIEITARTAWMLSKIVSHNRKDTVRFNYEERYGQVNADFSDYVVITDLVNNAQPPQNGNCNFYNSDLGIYNSQASAIFATEQRISEILYPLGKVVFQANTVRQDGYPGMQGYPAQKKLDKIIVYNRDAATNTYTVHKQIEFHQSYFVADDGSNTKRLRLDSLSILDSGNGLIQRYRFEYNNSIMLPDFASRKRDYWGYYNNVSNNTLVPRVQILYQACVSGCSQTTMWIGSNSVNGREPDPDFMQANILKKITYPTGGWTEFNYETNRYKDAGNQPKYAGGLRIHQIKSFDDQYPEPVVRTFKYGTNEDGFGRANFILDNYVFENTITSATPCTCGSNSTARQRTYGSSANINLEPFDGSPVVYATVTEYVGDAATNAGKNVYTYSDFVDQLNITFTLGTPVIESNHYKRGLLLSETSYKKTGTSTYQLIRQRTNSYFSFQDSMKFNIGFKVKKNYVTYVNGVDSPLGPDLETFCVQHDTDNYTFTHYAVKTGDNKLISSVETIYDQNNPSYFTTITTNYFYENYLHQQVTKTTTTNSLGKVVENTVKYPHESSGTVYTTMVQRHMLAYPIEEVTKVGGVQQQKIRRSYNTFSTNVIEPENIYRQILSGSEDMEVTMLGYDAQGNLLGYRARDGIDHAIVWGYKSSLPIATVTGATPNQVFYTSFEEETSGVSSGGYTGVKHKTTSYSKSLTGLPAGPYVLTYWRDTGSGWNFVSTNVTVSGSTYNISISAAKIDEVRFQPRDALMTTYAHSPGIGVTAVNDPNNLVSYYSYDPFGRLQAVSDLKKNIVKTYQYNYKLASQ